MKITYETGVIMQQKGLLKDRAFMSKTARLALPIAMQTLLMTTINMVDTLMIGQLGEATISAVGLANKFFFIFSLIMFGVTGGAGILTAQYWGKGDVKNIRRVLGLSVMLGVLCSVFFLLLALFTPSSIMRIFTESSEAIRIGSQYLSIVCLCYPLTAITVSYTASLRGVNQVKIPVIISITSLFTNIIFNYIFIFGKFGAPVMGAAGAAIATVIARVVELLLILSIVYIKKSPIAASIREMTAFDKPFIKLFFITVWPVIGNEFLYGVGTTLYSLAYGRMGDGAVASITITQTVEQLFSILSQGVGHAAVVILGNELGANKLPDADRHAKYFIWIQFIIGITVAGICYLSRAGIISLFKVEPETVVNVQRCLLVFCVLAPVKMFNFINIVGILRSGGDTTAAMIINTHGIWLLAAPAAFISGLVLKLPIYWVYALVTSEEIYKAILGFWRYRQKKWLRNLVKD